MDEFKVNFYNSGKKSFFMGDGRTDDKGFIGYLRGDFGRNGTEFWSTWFPNNEELNNDEFKQEVDNVVNFLREGILKDRSSMNKAAGEHRDCLLECDGTSYGVFVDTKHYEFDLRMNVNMGTYDYYIFCEDKRLASQDILNKKRFRDENGILTESIEKIAELKLPDTHKAKWFAGAALNTSEQAMQSVLSTALSRLNAFLDSEMEQILCFDTAVDAEKFCNTKSAIFLIMPEEDNTKYFLISLIVQQLYREMLAVADESGGKLKNRVAFYLDEIGTIPKIDSLEMMFSAGRSRRISIIAIIQSLAQLEKNYGNIANLLTNQSNSKLTESYTYYLNGNQKTKTSNNVTTSYAYDGMNRLVSENDTEYSFDDFGNRIAMANDDIEVTYEYDKNNRLLKSIETSDDSIKTTSYFYDYNGNQINKSIMTNVPYEDVDNADYTLSAETDGNIAIYDYNCYNQLVGVDTDGIKSTYSYSPDGLRLSKTVDGDAITFVYDNSNVVEEISNDGINKYYRGFEIIKNSNDLSYIYDGQGDVVILLDNLGTEVADYAFDAYGNQSEENTVYNPFGYRGEYTDQETGLIYLRARMYDSQTGRFINEDPVKDGLNWYVYCDGNPVNRIDPNGKNWFTNLIKEYFQTQQEIEMARIQANYEAQKNIQREIWRLGAQKYLREQKGYLTSAWMLEHSLQDNPDDIWRGNDSRIAYLINNDNAYLTKLDKAIKSSKSGKISQNLDNIAFKHNDLYYSIHRATIYVDGYKQSNGRWIVHATMKDTYDFTVIQTLMGDDGEFAMQAGLGTVANDAAVVSQSLGAINPYDVTVEFYTTR